MDHLTNLGLHNEEEDEQLKEDIEQIHRKIEHVNERIKNFAEIYDATESDRAEKEKKIE